MKATPPDRAPSGPNDVANPTASAGHDRGLAYQPALDGIRALAVTAVLLYHGGVSWGAGGYLGVEAFFVLSGFLITSLLVAEWRDSGAIKLRSFWGRRARRLLPALFCVVAVVGLHQALAGASHAVPDLFADGLSTLFYVANWHQIWTGSGYFARTGPQSPLLHTWSLAIEEQFYVIWPLAVLGVLTLFRRRHAATEGQATARTSALRALLVVAVLGALLSAVEMAWLYHGGSGQSRVYYGTDTRAQGLLVGAALAFGLALLLPGRRAKLRPAAVGILGAAGVVGLGGLVLGVHLAGFSAGEGPGVYRGGFLAFDAAAITLICSVVLAPRMPVARLLGIWPLRSIGKISYGLYLWHYPLFLWLDQSSTGLSGAGLFALRVAITVAVATGSYFLVEQPIRHRRLPDFWLAVSSVPAVGAAVLALVLGSSVPAGAVGSTPGGAGDGYQPSGPTTTIAPLPTQVSWTGDQGPCKVRLPTIEPSFDMYHTCPPVKVIMMGDSMAETLAFGMGSNEQHYGILMDDDSELGCSFGVKGPGDWSGIGFQGQFTPCLGILSTWRAQVEALKPQAIVVLMGYWDCFDRSWDGQDVHIGEPAFDAYLFNRMKLFVQTEGAGGVPIVLLTVPYADPPPFADGSPAPAASVQRHNLIDAMLARLAATYPQQVHLVNTDSYVSPGGHFDATVNGHPCRWSDGIHFYPYCGALVGAHVLPLIRQLVAARGGPGPQLVRSGLSGTGVMKADP